MTFKLGLIGAGRMGSAIISGLISHGYKSTDIAVCTKTKESSSNLKKLYNITVLDNNENIINSSSTVILAVKPQIFENIFQPLIPILNDKKPLLISIMAGISLKYFCKNLGSSFPIVRTMPNTPGKIGCGITALHTHSTLEEKFKIEVETIMQVLGQTVWVNSDDDMDVVTSISGTGPAYFYYFFDSLTKSAVKLGLSEDVAKKLVIQTAIGSVNLSNKNDKSFTDLINDVKSPNGTTEAAFKIIYDEKLDLTIYQIVKAAYDRAKTLSTF